MKKYPFPHNVGSMSDSDYREYCRKRFVEESAVKNARKIRLEESRKRRDEVRAAGPVGRISRLALGESVTLSGYKKTSQLSSAIRHAYIATGGRYASALARAPDMLTGETEIVTGVTITRTH